MFKITDIKKLYEATIHGFPVWVPKRYKWGAVNRDRELRIFSYKPEFDTEQGIWLCCSNKGRLVSVVTFEGEAAESRTKLVFLNRKKEKYVPRKVKNPWKTGLDEEDMKRIYIDEKFRQEVAYAHPCQDSSGIFLHLKTCAYPRNNERIVTEEQRAEALAEMERRGKEILEVYKNDLLFVGMGMPFENSPFGNHRIRTCFINDKGTVYFLEFSAEEHTEKESSYVINHSIKDYDLATDDGQRLPMEGSRGTITEIQDLVDWVNRTFDCSFRTYVMDQYNVDRLFTGPICISPGKKEVK